MKIAKIGYFVNGSPVGWQFEGEGEDDAAIHFAEFSYRIGCLSITKDGRVKIGDVEVVEWTNACRHSMTISRVIYPNPPTTELPGIQYCTGDVINHSQ